MFGYVSPYKMELKIKDYEKFKAYYCGLCLSIKKNFGNLPRLTLNYDMTFLAVLLDSLSEGKTSYIKGNCILHPFKKRIFTVNNEALDYAAFCNVCLTYYKLLDDYDDDKSLKGKLMASFLDIYLKNIPERLEFSKVYMGKKLKELYSLENSVEEKNIDELSHPFADLTGFLLSSYENNSDTKFDLYLLGYNLGKWIYIIDAFDDLEKDMENGKFNALTKAYNCGNMQYKDFKSSISERVEFSLSTCARKCYEYLNNLPLNKNEELLHNILQYGLLEKMNTVFKRGVYDNEKSL